MQLSPDVPPRPRRGLRLDASHVTLVGVLGAVTALLASVPGLGFVPAPTPAGAATTLHVPAILAGITRGPLAGALVGAVFGFFSFTRATLPFFKHPLIAFGPRILIGVVAYYTFALLGQRASRAVAAVAVGAAAYAALGPGAAAFEAAYASGEVSRNALANAYHAVAAAALARPWLPPLAAALVAGTAWGLLRGPLAPVAAAAVAGTLTNTVGVLALIVALFDLPPGAAVLVGVTHGLPEAVLAVLVVVPTVRALRAAGLAG